VNARASAVGAGLLALAGLGIALRGGALGWAMLLGFGVLAARFALRPRPRDGRRLAAATAGFVVGVLLLAVGMVAVWETAEVVVLRQRDDDGAWFATRLWIIDLRGTPSFAARDPAEHRRIALLERHPDVELVRHGRSECRRAVLARGDAELGEEARRLYAEKYGFRIRLANELVVFLVGGGAKRDPVLVRLEPCAGGVAGAGG